MSAPPMAYYGGKTQLAARIAALLPPHEHYVEPYAGSLAVLLEKQPSRLETVNDLDGDLMTFWRVLRDKPTELMRMCALTPHSRQEYEEVDTLGATDELERARRVWVQIAHGRAGTLRKTGWRYVIDPQGRSGSVTGDLHAYIDRMAVAAERLQKVTLECRPADELIAAYGRFPSVCLYLDPPYLGSIRCTNYRTEMTSDADHARLLELVKGCAASVVMSGYASDIYDTALADWSRIEISTSTGQGSKYGARTEVLWSNRDLHVVQMLDFEEPA